jgi:hypothetical protein
MAVFFIARSKYFSPAGKKDLTRLFFLTIEQGKYPEKHNRFFKQNSVFFRFIKKSLWKNLIYI